MEISDVDEKMFALDAALARDGTGTLLTGTDIEDMLLFIAKNSIGLGAMLAGECQHCVMGDVTDEDIQDHAKHLVHEWLARHDG